MRMYSSLAPWFPLLSPPEEYAEEAAVFAAIFQKAGARSLLELGAGAGCLASHLKTQFQLTLTDLSPEMLDVCRSQNPECEILTGDMRSVRLNREFDGVLIHDAIMYATEAHDVRAAIATAVAHCRTGGVVVVAPDHVRETFEPESSIGGGDAPDGRGVRYLEWDFDLDPSDTVCEVQYALVLKNADGSTSVEGDRHTIGLFPRSFWLECFGEAGLTAEIIHDQWNRDLFVGHK